MQILFIYFEKFFFGVAIFSAKCEKYCDFVHGFAETSEQNIYYSNVQVVECAVLSASERKKKRKMSN